MLSNTKINNKVSLIAYLIANGISVPHYCYHNDLSIAGNCRVCLVELKDSMKPVVSCATDAETTLSNNSVYHDSALVKKAKENILEFLLLNHPLDCPICDQGGGDLQDHSLFFGLTKRRFYKCKRIISDKDLGPIIKTVMTRCIHCTRCVRFAKEIAGVENLGMFGRGGNSEIGTYPNKILTSELSGNVIDLCPVGVITDKNYRYKMNNIFKENKIICVVIAIIICLFVFSIAYTIYSIYSINEQIIMLTNNSFHLNSQLENVLIKNVELELELEMLKKDNMEYKLLTRELSAEFSKADLSLQSDKIFLCKLAMYIIAIKTALWLMI